MILNTKPTASKNQPQGLNDTQRRNIRIIALLLLSVLGVCLLLAIVSFFAYWHVDQNFLEHYAQSDHAANWMGQWGNSIASALVNKGFGVAALCIPVMLLWLAVYGFCKNRIHIPIRKPLLGLALGMVLLSLTFGVFVGERAHFGSGLSGGHGYAIGYLMLVTTLGRAGAVILLLLAYIAFFYYLAPQPVHRAALALWHLVFPSSKPDEKAAENVDLQPVADGTTIELSPVIPQKPAKTTTPEDIEITVVVDEDDETPTPVVETKEPETIEKPSPSEVVIDPNTGLPMPVVGIGDVLEAEEILVSQLPYDPKKDLEFYEYPSPDLLNDYQKGARSVTNEELENNKNRIVTALGHFGISIKQIKATIGPTITLYEIVPADGVRISKIRGLEDDIALSLSALGIRIIAPMPGKGTIGIEVPNLHPEIVPMQAIIKSQEFQDTQYDLPIALGKTITNKAFVLDLAKMPHLLIAGATGQGKSVGLNAVLVSLLYKMHPSQLKLVLVDPKKVELPLYAKIEKHFLAKLPDTDEAIITDNQKVIYTINSLCTEMEARYDLLKTAAVRNIKEYNQKFIDRKLNPNKGHRYLPYIVLVIDEFADLIMTAGKEIETPIARLAQLARAIGIHLIIATQRPTTNIITGLIKANFPARIAFRVTSMIDSRTILDQSGAQQLIGKGDMLVSTGSDMVRVQCAFVDTPEVEHITDFIGKQQGYVSAHELPEYTPPTDDGRLADVDLTKRDALFDQAARLIVDTQSGSTSLIQRKMELGYNRAGKIMDQLEAAGIVGAQDGSKPRQVLITDPQSLEQILARM
ncbi:DNA translocase FtsK [Bacteroidia bacterium]|nr:DNA translocase FtsK [Bacteroidia bacterium]